MRSLVYSMQMSLDGFIARSNGELDWHVIDEQIHRHFNEQERATDILLYGRRLYELMADFWPTADRDPSLPEYEAEYSAIWREKPKVVFSRTLERVDWNSRLVSGDAAVEVARLKAEGEGVMSVGGAELGSSLLAAGLVDEVRAYVVPVVLGDGKPMFAPMDATVPLRLIDTFTFGSGVVQLRYEVGRGG